MQSLPYSNYNCRNYDGSSGIRGIEEKHTKQTYLDATEINHVTEQLNLDSPTVILN